MRNSTLTLALIAIITCVALTSTTALADLCALKNGDYTLTGKSSPSDGTDETATPCATADAADGTTDTVINIDYTPTDTTIALDVVYEQNVSASELLVIGGFKYKLLFDSTAMGSTPTCSPDPASFFMNMGSGCPTTDDNSANVTYYEGFDLLGTYGPDPINFVLDQISYTAGSTWVDGYSYTSTFNTTDTLRTDVLAGFCYVLSGAEASSGGCDGITTQSIYTTKLNVTAPSCYSGPPSSASVTCKGQTGCSIGSGTADVSLTYSIPTKCYIELTAGTCTEHTGCGGYGVSFTDAASGAQTGTSGTFTETVALTSSGPALTYNLTGTEATLGCSPSSALPSSCLTTFTLSTTADASVTCKCGDPPTITLQDTNKYMPDKGGTFYQGRAITIEYVVTDPDASEYGGLTSSIATIMFYYSNDGGTTIKSEDVKSDMDPSGNLKVTIPKEYVIADTNIYFGIIVTDKDGLSGRYPTSPAFDETDLTTGDGIDGTQIIKGTACEFQQGADPYPNQFPFRASANSVLMLRFAYTDEAEVTMRIYSLDGMLVRQIETSGNKIPDWGEKPDCTGEDCNRCNYESGCMWDGTSYEGGGNLVANGMYIVNLHAICTSAFAGQSHNYTKTITVMK